MVSDILALFIYILVNVFIKVILSGSRAAAPKGTKSCRTQTSKAPTQASKAPTQASKALTQASKAPTQAS